VNRVPEAPQPLGGKFWRLFTSSGISNLADGIAIGAVPLLAATMTRDPVVISGLVTLQFLPWLLFAALAGALVDRWDRKVTMAATNLVRASLFATVALLVILGRANLTVLYVGAFLLGTAETVYDSAARALLPQVVSRANLERGNALLFTVESVGNRFAGAPLGAWLFVFAAALPLWVDSAAYVLAALVILTLSGRYRPERTETTTLSADLREGLGWLRRHSMLFPLMLTTGGEVIAYSMTSGVFVLYALDSLGLPETGYGLLLATGGFAAIVGSLISPWLVDRLSRTVALGLSIVVCSVSAIAMGVWPIQVVGFVAWFASTFALAVYDVQIMSIRQAMIPEKLFGRVQGAYRTVIWGGIPLGTLLGGAVGRALGIPPVFVISGIAGLITGSASWWILHRNRAAIAAALEEKPA
jgi:MFS family permease